MDLITQCQNYVAFLANAYASSLDHIHTQAPSIEPPSAALLQLLSKIEPSSSSSSSLAQLALPTLPQSYVTSIEERSSAIVTRVVELDTLFASLPATFSSEQEQLRVLKGLIQRDEEEQVKEDAAKSHAVQVRLLLERIIRESSHQYLNVNSFASSAQATNLTPSSAHNDNARFQALYDLKVDALLGLSQTHHDKAR